jgi:hypothetical protein
LIGWLLFAGGSGDAEPELVSPDEGLRVESASRLEWDRSKIMRGTLDARVDPVKADADFMRCLLEVLRKVGHHLGIAKTPGAMPS